MNFGKSAPTNSTLLLKWSSDFLILSAESYPDQFSATCLTDSVPHSESESADGSVCASDSPSSMESTEGSETESDLSDEEMNFIESLKRKRTTSMVCDFCI